jgi:hypothetical protein
MMCAIAKVQLCRKWNDWPYYRVEIFADPHNLTTYFPHLPLETNLHSPPRRLIELRMEHGDLDALIDRALETAPVDELMMRRLKKKRLSLRDEIARLEESLQPDEPA